METAEERVVGTWVRYRVDNLVAEGTRANPWYRRAIGRIDRVQHGATDAVRVRWIDENGVAVTYWDYAASLEVVPDAEVALRMLAHG